MAKFNVRVKWITHEVCYADMVVEAEDEDDAAEKAYDELCKGFDPGWSDSDITYGEYEADYSSIAELPEEPKDDNA